MAEDWFQRIVKLAPRRRGVHLVTAEILEKIPEIVRLRVGILHLFIQHTSASITIIENADPDVQLDFE
ncbi:MAG: YjbQ family protein, partial [Planctomycetota bacterium]